MWVCHRHSPRRHSELRSCSHSSPPSFWPTARISVVVFRTHTTPRKTTPFPHLGVAARLSARKAPHHLRLADTPYPRTLNSPHGLHQAPPRRRPPRRNHLQRPHLDASPRHRRQPLPHGRRRNRDRLHRPIGFPDITPQLARASGFLGVLDLLKVAKHGKGDNIYLVRFHYIPPARPKPALETQTCP